jgi:hypothetical protein
MAIVIGEPELVEITAESAQASPGDPFAFLFGVDDQVITPSLCLEMGEVLLLEQVFNSGTGLLIHEASHLCVL